MCSLSVELFYLVQRNFAAQSSKKLRRFFFDSLILSTFCILRGFPANVEI